MNVVDTMGPGTLPCRALDVPVSDRFLSFLCLCRCRCLYCIYHTCVRPSVPSAWIHFGLFDLSVGLGRQATEIGKQRRKKDARAGSSSTLFSPSAEQAEDKVNRPTGHCCSLFIMARCSLAGQLLKRLKVVNSRSESSFFC